MADDPTSTTDTNPAGDAPEEKADGDNTAPATGANPDAKDLKDEDAVLGEAGQKALADERKARKEAEKQARELAKKLKEFEDKDLTEAQKIQRERDDFKTKYEQLSGELKSVRADKNISSSISKLKVSDENAKLIRALVKESDYSEDEDGGSNADELVRAVAKAFPQLAQKPTSSVDTGAGKGSPAKNSSAALGAFLRG